jgi:hypothetical protein
MQDSHSSKDRFSDDREALDFIASRIAGEAQLDGVSFSEVERKMLYFSETASTLPDIWDVNDQFDREYETHAYEKKISQLIKKAVARARKQQSEEFDAWIAAIRRLSKEDRYLLVMVKQAGIGRTTRSPWPSRNWWKLCFAGVIVASLFSVFTWIVARVHPVPGGYRPRSGSYASPTSEAISFSIWAFPVFMCVVYGLLYLLLGTRGINEIMNRGTEWIFGTSRRRK